MKKTYLLIAFLLYLFVPLYQCLFTQTPNTNISLTATTLNKVVLESSGSKFLTWNYNSQIKLYNVNGSLICNTTYPQQIQKIVWPTEYYPIILPFPGLQISTLNYSSCQIIKNFDLKVMTNMTNSTDQIYDMTFIWRNGGPYVALTAMFSVWQIDLSSVSMINAYLTIDSTFPRYQSTTYSKDYKNIYVVMADANSGTRTVRVWQTKTPFGKPLRELTFTTSVSAMTPSNDNSTIICVGSSMTQDTTTLYRFDDTGVIRNKATKSGIVKALTIGNGNTVALFKTGSGAMELVRAGDGKTVQNITFSSSNYMLDADFQNKVLIILDSSNRVLTYSYSADEDVQPIPDPVNPAKSFPVWIVIVSVIFGILILAVVLMYIFQEKLPQNLRKKLPKCFNKEKKEEKSALINEKPSKQNIQPNIPKPQPNNQNPPPQPGPYQNQHPQYRPPNNNDSFQDSQRQRDGFQGLTDAQIIQAKKKEQQRLKQRRRQEEFERRRRQQLFERQEKQKKYREEQEQRQKQFEYRRQKEWEEQNRLKEIERRRREEYEREVIRREEMERMRKEEEARRFFEYQKMEEERKRIEMEMENKRKEEIRRIEYQRFLQEQQRRKYQPQPPYQQPYQPPPPYQQPYQQPYQPYSGYPSSNPNIYVPGPQPYNPGYNPNIPMPPRQPVPEPQQRNFVDQRKNLFSNVNAREENPNPMEEIDEDEIPISKSFFRVKRKDDEEGSDSQVRGDEDENKFEE